MSDFFSAKPENIEYEFLTPGTGERSGVFVELRPRYAPEVKEVERRLAARNQKNRKRNLTPAETMANLREIWAARIVRWFSKDPAMDVVGRLGEPTRENILKFLEDFPWYEEQILEALGDTDSFFETAPTPQSNTSDTSPDTE